MEDDINAEDDEAPEEDALAAPAAAAQPAPVLVSPRKAVPASAVAWAGAAIVTSGGCAFYRCALPLPLATLACVCAM